MYLKRLEVVGFKSFADRTRLEFEPGIASIVGPNGCGKSNIIDAIRWCLGEMSVKSLRSSLMMDVVFNGSGTRPAQNMAEVTLSFDNSDKRLPIDYSEVAITRRLFRSGESEYYINKTQCRLRDIRELFLDTGMGEDGYSTMEQGKVEWILQAKPEVRRELFEEAAGVSKYRARREEALRKLDKVDIDLSRLNDIISVTRDQIRKMENAVNRAKTYERIRGELKTLEIQDWLFQLNSTETDLKILNEKLQASETQAEELNTLLHQIQVDLSEKRTALTATEEQYLKANNALNQIDSDIKIAQERLNHSESRENQLNIDIENLRVSIAREEKRVQELNDQIKTQEKALQEIKDKGSTIEEEFNEAQQQHDISLKNLEDRRQASKSLRDLILQRVQQRTKLQQEIGYLSTDVSKFDSQSESLLKEKERCQSKINEISATSESVKTALQQLNGQMEEKSTGLNLKADQIKNLNTNEEALQKTLLKYSENIAQLKGQIESIKEQQNQDPYIAGPQALLSSGISGIYGPIGRLISCPLGSDRDLVAAAIGENFDDMIAETISDAQNAIDYLSQNGKGRARIWILEKFSPTQPVQSWNEGESLIRKIHFDEKFRPVIQFLTSSSFVKGSTVYGSSFVNGGVDPSQWKTFVTHRLPELEDKLIQEEHSKTESENQLQILAAQQIVFTEEREQLIKEREEFRIRVEVGQKELTKLESEQSILKQEKEVVENEHSQLSSDYQSTKDKLKVSQEEIEKLLNQEQDDHAQLDICHQELTEFQLKHAEANAELATKREKHTAYIEQLTWQEKVLKHSSEEKQSTEGNKDHHQKSIETAQSELNQCKILQVESRKTIEESIFKRNEAADHCSAIQNTRTTLSNEINEKDQLLTKQRSEHNQILSQLQDFKLSQVTIQSRHDNTIQKLHEHYEMTLDQAKAEYEPISGDPEALDKLRKRVSSMGPINLAAPQEHQELLEKEKFLTSQQEDLLKAKEDLRQVISKINATTKEHFKETFEKVRENFRRLYSQLFQGGEADLHLTDSSDILNAGVDIYCQPPGKKLLHISLLSGGEKALTACALLFAFFQVRPSPVALLDEVDAPLDEANILRYVEMLKLFSEKSQFLIITHNKRTMEVAKTLYGVTHEELGVSKVLSARLQKDRKKIEASIESEPASVSS